jgi:hypothetical protein
MWSNQVVKMYAQGKVIRTMKNKERYCTRRPRLARREAAIGYQKHEHFGGMKRCAGMSIKDSCNTERQDEEARGRE